MPNRWLKEAYRVVHGLQNVDNSGFYAGGKGFAIPLLLNIRNQ